MAADPPQESHDFRALLTDEETGDVWLPRGHIAAPLPMVVGTAFKF